MPSLGDTLGALMASIAKARQHADEQTVAIARAYQADPLLNTFPAPRMRLPMVEIELPAILTEVVEAQDAVIPALADTVDLCIKIINAEVQRAGVTLNGDELGILSQALEAGLSTAWPVVSSSSSPQAVFLAQVRVIMNDLASSRGRNFAILADAKVQARVETILTRNTTFSPAVEADIRVDVATSSVKEVVDPNLLPRVKLQIREEGVQWLAEVLENGETKYSLTDE